MKYLKKKKNIFSKLSTMGVTISILIMKCGLCFAEGIGTAEVKTATENIQRVITSIAMPLRWCFNFCKYCSCCNKNDSKC